MKLEEFKKEIDTMYNKYGGNIDVTIDITANEDEDDTICKNELNHIWTESIKDITEVKDYLGENVTGICLSNYIMEDKNWGKDD